jgi:hypothetical protein
VLSYPTTENITGLTTATIEGANIISAPSLTTNARTVTLRIQWTNTVDVGTVELNLIRTSNGSTSAAKSPLSVG